MPGSCIDVVTRGVCAALILSASLGPVRADDALAGDGVNGESEESAWPEGLPRVPAWEAYQGNAWHTGYVPLDLKPRWFVKAWEWTSPRAIDGVTPFINPITISGGLVAVSDDDYFSPQSLYVLRESDGALVWQHDFPDGTPALNPPTIRGGRVYVATSGHEATFMHAFDAYNGTLLWQSPFSAQWEHYLAPTVLFGGVHTAGGYYGGAYQFQVVDGVQNWFAQLPQVDMFTPAVDRGHVYVYAGARLSIINRTTGVVEAAITDPDPSSLCCYSFIGAPIRTLRQRVISFSGENFSGRASSSTGGYYSRSLISFDLANRRIDWRTDQLYITQPAVAHGMVFAGSNSPVRLAAIDQGTGRVVWGWTPSDGATAFCRNVIATRSHVFVSTDKAVHAIDLASRRSVWSIDVPGELALSDSGTLFINEGCRESTGRMIAVRSRWQ